MFQTTLQVWLQQFDNEWLIRFFQLITALGYPQFFFLFLLAVVFGISFRKGFILLLLIMWTTVVTILLKEAFELPRPYMVSEQVQLWDGGVDTDVAILKNGSATYFFELLPKQTTDYFKNKTIPNGFPSGHTSIAIAFWGALGLLFRKKWLNFIVIPLIFLIPFSRVYLGVHFVADILGGYLIGGIMLWSFYKLVINPSSLKIYMQTHRHKFAFDIKTFLILIPPIIGFLLLEDSKYLIATGVPLGFGLGFLIIAEKGLPIETGSLFHRMSKVLSAVAIFVLTILILDIIAKAINISDNRLYIFVKYILAAFNIAALATLLHFRLQWSKREKHEGL
jgi:membrane-associated phospholipid phosphatase